MKEYYDFAKYVNLTKRDYEEFDFGDELESNDHIYEYLKIMLKRQALENRTLADVIAEIKEEINN